MALKGSVLVTEFDWPYWHNLSGEEFASSPSGQIRAARLTAPYTDWPWQMASHWDPFAPQKPDWTAFFSWGTPREILSEFHRVVATTFGQDERLDPLQADALPVETALVPLIDAGWQQRAARGSTTCTSPDGLATVSVDFDASGFGWNIDITAGELYWGARLGLGMPALLVRAAIEAVANPEPVERRRSELAQDVDLHRRVAPARVRASGTDTRAIPPHSRTAEPPVAPVQRPGSRRP